MNILYISKLNGKPWIGPTYSVPSQIFAQSRYDNVFWYNLIETFSSTESAFNDILQKWRSFSFYHDLNDFPIKKIASLPKPFDNPDLVVFEQCYPFAKESLLIKEIKRRRIPYVVIPRGEFTNQAQSKKRIKKIVGNIVFRYKSFLNKALAIQCLTEQENRETGLKWNKRRLIIPNGVNVNTYKHKEKSDNGFVFISIGRYEPYQKGLDLLIEALSVFKSDLLSKGIRVELYGSNAEGKRIDLEHLCEKRNLQEVVFFNDAVFNEAKRNALAGADVFLMPSRFEGHPTGLLEALSFGLPCLATTGSNMRKEIENNDAGWGADNNVYSICDALKKLISELPNLEEKRKNAYNLALKYSWDSIAKEAHKEYEELLSSKR